MKRYDPVSRCGVAIIWTRKTLASCAATGLGFWSTRLSRYAVITRGSDA